MTPGINVRAIDKYFRKNATGEIKIISNDRVFDPEINEVIDSISEITIPTIHSVEISEIAPFDVLDKFVILSSECPENIDKFVYEGHEFKLKRSIEEGPYTVMFSIEQISS